MSLLQQEIESFVNLKDGVFDGEIIDNYEKDSFKKVMEQISRKNYCLENFEFRIFDFIPLVDFQQGSSPLIFHQRLDLLRQYINNQDLKFCKLLEQCPYTEESFSKWKETMKENNWEGLMLRKNAIWEGKRTNNLLKYKIMHDEEFTVIDLDFGPFRVIDENTNLEKEIHCLSSVTIDYHNTKVGSGFTLEERIKFFKTLNVSKTNKSQSNILKRINKVCDFLCLNVLSIKFSLKNYNNQLDYFFLDFQEFVGKFFVFFCMFMKRIWM